MRRKIPKRKTKSDKDARLRPPSKQHQSLTPPPSPSLRRPLWRNPPRSPASNSAGRCVVSCQAKSKPRAVGTHAAVLFACWPASNETIVANPRRPRGDHEFALVGKDQGSTEKKKNREPRNTPKPRKQGINGARIVSVCSLCSVVRIRNNGSVPRPLAKRVGSIRQILRLQPLGMKSFVFEPPLTQRLRVAFCATGDFDSHRRRSASRFLASAQSERVSSPRSKAATRSSTTLRCHSGGAVEGSSVVSRFQSSSMATICSSRESPPINVSSVICPL